MLKPISILPCVHSDPAPFSVFTPNGFCRSHWTVPTVSHANISHVKMCFNPQNSPMFVSPPPDCSTWKWHEMALSARLGSRLLIMRTCWSLPATSVLALPKAGGWCFGLHFLAVFPLKQQINNHYVTFSASIGSNNLVCHLAPVPRCTSFFHHSLESLLQSIVRPVQCINSKR